MCLNTLICKYLFFYKNLTFYLVCSSTTGLAIMAKSSAIAHFTKEQCTITYKGQCRYELLINNCNGLPPRRQQIFYFMFSLLQHSYFEFIAESQFTIQFVWYSFKCYLRKAIF